MWEASTARCVYTQTLATVSNKEEEEEEEKDDDPRSLMYLLHLPASSRLATVTAEHNILLYQLPGLTTQQQVGTEDPHEGLICRSSNDQNICSDIITQFLNLIYIDDFSLHIIQP